MIRRDLPARPINVTAPPPDNKSCSMLSRLIPGRQSQIRLVTACAMLVFTFQSVRVTMVPVSAAQPVSRPAVPAFDRVPGNHWNSRRMWFGLYATEDVQDKDTGSKKHKMHKKSAGVSLCFWWLFRLCHQVLSDVEFCRAQADQQVGFDLR